LHQTAVEAICADYGSEWRIKAPFGDTVLATLDVPAYRKVKTVWGFIQWPKDHRLPASRYWPDGVIPEAFAVHGDYAREDGSRLAYRVMRSRVASEIRERHAHRGSQDWHRVDHEARELLADLRAMGKPAPAVEHDAAWHKAHGYAWNGKFWVPNVGRTLEFLQADWAAERAALEEACLTYGPQPLPVDDDAEDLAEAA
jgi:hypothetical protein